MFIAQTFWELPLHSSGIFVLRKVTDLRVTWSRAAKDITSRGQQFRLTNRYFQLETLRYIWISSVAVGVKRDALPFMSSALIEEMLFLKVGCRTRVCFV